VPGPPKNVETLAAQDRRLVDRCLKGDVTAWSEIYRQFHDRLLSSIRSLLGRQGQDTNLVEEIAARVWYALVKNNHELLAKFDARRGCRLSTFLFVLAKNETRVLFRSERRRRSREQVASRSELEGSATGDLSTTLSDEEFLITLSPAERTFYLDVLVAQPTQREEAQQAYSAEYLWQLRHRVRKKLERFILETST
jgi:DNA-directed RNA polymerase specialized sigma24 family protein